MRNLGRVLFFISIFEIVAIANAQEDLTVNSFSAYAGQTNIVLQAGDNILFTGGALTLPSLPGGSIGQLTVQAGNNITVDIGTTIVAGAGWSISMMAGTNFSGTVSSGNDGIYLDGSSTQGSTIQTQNGNINLWAANEVQVGWSGSSAGPGVVNLGSSSIVTFNGGNISVTTAYGDVNSGSDPSGFDFRATAPYYTVDANLGGISTAAGGNVTISAGGNVISHSSTASDCGTGAFGSPPGNVTITAGESVFGHFVTANGTGTVLAGQNAGAAGASDPFALSLISGSWNVSAPNGNIYLQEVRNPNGDFNSVTGVRGASTPGKFLFNYSPQASVTLSANGVYLTDLNVPRLTVGPVPVLYPPILNITAGSGGLTLEGDVALFPSTYQYLNINITNGGNFSATESGTAPYYLLMSDSAQTQWQTVSTFSAIDHGGLANEPNDSSPAFINISGNMEDLNLITTKVTDITVGEDMTNCCFSGQNLQSSDVTVINVAGQIDNTGTQFGYRVGGPGQFDVTASSISLGNCAGILSCGIYDPAGGFNRYANLASITPAGAGMNVTVSGDLNMTNSTIASLAGGDLDVFSTGGSVDVGSPESLKGSYFALGVYTTGGGDVNVTADGDVDIGDSRIGTYDGGDIFVESITGNVDIGNGATELNTIYSVYSGESSPYAENVYGGGIMAETLAPPLEGEAFPPDAAMAPGNITVETPEGDIIASSDGITQLSPGGVLPSGPTVTLRAGSPGFIGNISLGADGVIGGTITLNATGSIAGPALNTSISQSNGGFIISWTVSNVQLDISDANNFEIESSSDLVNWQVINPAISTTTNGGLSFVTSASTNSSCFYRIQWQ